MPDKNPHLDSLFEAAVRITSATERAAFLDQACGADRKLRSDVEHLLRSDALAGSFLAKPIAKLDASVIGQAPDDLAAAMDAGMAATFGPNEAVVLGEAGHSVLKMFGQTVHNVPRVALREPTAEGPDPVVKPQSPEIPQKDSDSRYRLDGEIARGGMGAILKGRDTDLGRDLAIKVLLEQHKDKPDVVQRFIEEAQIGGQLQHPGIAPVYELGQFRDRRPFFSMKLVKGQTFSKLLAGRKAPAEERGKFLGIFEQICQTMAYAHSRGVIHRDLKPANIMIGAFGEVQLMDWGLAKVLQSGGIADEKKAQDQQSGQSIIRTLRSQVGSDPPGMPGTIGSIESIGSHTQMGSVMGTPAYMPPEQALGEIDSLDERADVFGLGAILCEILTGQPPYVGSDAAQVYRMASRGKLADCSARLDASGADTELIAIAKHCLEIEPHDRPRDAGVLAERISAYLASVESRLHAAELQSAAEAARAEEALRTAKEQALAASAERRARKLQVGLAAVVLCVLAVGGIAATWTAAVQSRLKNDALSAEQTANAARKRAEDEQARAESEKSRAEVAQRQAEDEKIRSINLLADMQTERGLQAGREGQAAMAALWFANAAALTPHDPARQVANQRRAVAWSGESMQPVAMLNLDGDVRRAMFLPGDALLLIVTNPSRLTLWNWREEAMLPWSEQFPATTDAALSPDGKVIAALLDTGEVRLLEPATGNVQRRFNAGGEMSLIEWSPDGERVAVAGRQLQIWNVREEPVLESDWAHPAKIYGMRFNRSGTRIVTGGDDDMARVFAINDTTLPSPIYPGLPHKPAYVARQATPLFCDGDNRLVTLHPNLSKLELHDAANGAIVPTQWKLASLDRSLELSPDGRWIAASGFGHAGLLSVDGSDSHVLPHPNHLSLALFAPDGQSLATLCWDGVARLFPLRELDRGVVGKPTQFPQRGTFAWGAFSRNGKALAISANRQRQMVVWEQTPAVPIVGRIPWDGPLWRARPSFDGQFVTPGMTHEFYTKAIPIGTTLKVARMVDGSAAGPPIMLKGLLWDSCICADNASVAAVTVDQAEGWLSLFDIATGTSKWEPIALPSLPLSVAPRPGRSQVAVLCQNGSLLVVDTTRGMVERHHEHPGLTPSDHFPNARVAYSPDGATLVSVQSNDQISLRDAQTGELRCPPFSPLIEGGVCRSIAFSPDSRLFATAVTGRNMAQVWSLATGEKVGVGMSHPGDLFGIWSLTFSPDGQRIVTSHKDGRVRIFDWKTGAIVGDPLQHSGEVSDVKFTDDGKFLLASAGYATLFVWDVSTGKLAIPLLRDLTRSHAHCRNVSIVGQRAVICGDSDYRVLDLSALLPPIEEDVPSLLRRAELATNLKLHVGEVVPMEAHEWSARWEQHVAARQVAAESLAQALDDAADAPAKTLVIARAARNGLIQPLKRLRPKSPELSAAASTDAPPGSSSLRQEPEGYPRLMSRVQELVQMNKLEEALAVSRKAREVAPENAAVYDWIGFILRSQGKLDEAIPEFRRALELDPNFAYAHANLGAVLVLRNQSDEALSHLTKARELIPERADIPWYLGQALLQLGRFDDAVSSLNQAVELSPKDTYFARTLSEAKRKQEVAATLKDFVDGKLEPRDDADRLVVAEVCLHRKQFIPAVRFFAAAIESISKSPDGVPPYANYNAACAASRASAGEGDAAQLPEADRQRYREQAVQFLRAELSSVKKRLASASPNERADIIAILKLWPRDTDLAPLRGDESLWSEHAELLK